MASFKKLLGKVFGGTLVGLAKKEMVDKPKEQAARAQEEAQAQSLLAQQQAETAAQENAAEQNVTRRRRMRAQSLLSRYTPDQASLGGGGAAGKTLLGM